MLRVLVTCKTGFALDDWTYWHLIHTALDYRQYSAVAILHPFQFTVTHALGFSVFTSRILATDFVAVSLSLQITHEVFFSQPNSFHAIIQQLPNQFDSIAPELISLQAGISKLDSTRLLSCQLRKLPYNHFARTTQKTASIEEACVLICCLAMDVLLLGAFASAGISLLTRCLAVGIHVTILIKDFGSLEESQMSMEDVQEVGSCQGLACSSSSAFVSNVFWVRSTKWGIRDCSVVPSGHTVAYGVYVTRRGHLLGEMWRIVLELQKIPLLVTSWLHKEHRCPMRWLLRTLPANFSVPCFDFFAEIGLSAWYSSWFHFSPLRLCFLDPMGATVRSHLLNSSSLEHGAAASSFSLSHKILAFYGTESSIALF
jgi:hypothetical protein